MKTAPSYFEHNAGQPQAHVPEADTRDSVEFEDVTIEVAQLHWVDLTPEQRAVFEAAFN